MDYMDYSPEDFLSDESFLNYCFNKNQSDISFWEDWVRSHPERWDIINEARASCYRMGIRLSPEEKEKEWRKLEESIYSGIIDEDDPEGKEENTRKKPLFSRSIPLLASLAAGLLFFAGMRWFNESFELRNRKEMVVYTSYTTGVGERRTITLPDGTVALLNAGSRMDVPSDYNQGKRKIVLKGDAFFEVAPNQQQPFSVDAGGMSTVALGTSFRIRAYSFEENVQVMLLTGKVEVKDRNHSAAAPVYLAPGQEVMMDLNHHTILKKEFDTGQMNDWKAGRLIFKDATLAEIAVTLQNWYGIRVELKGNITRKIHFNGEFSGVNRNLQAVMKTLDFINGMKHEIRNNVLIMTVK